MARSRKKKKPLLDQVKETLLSKMATGESKKDDKAVYARDAYDRPLRDEKGEKIILKEDKTRDKIYSWNTYHTYKRHCDYFVKWCRENYECGTLSKCRGHADEYIKKLIDEGKSPYTVKMTVSALSKLYGCGSKDFISTPSRKREDIKRSRSEENTNSKNFSEEKNSELVNFCRCTGLRRAELEHIVGTDLEYVDGKPNIHVQRFSKGGRERYAEIVGSPEEVEAVVERMMRAGKGLVWGPVKGHADIHGYRSDYCNRIYKKYARPILTLEPKEIYYCQKDLEGVKYDKRAMAIASKNLGHNRINIIAGNYLRAGDME